MKPSLVPAWTSAPWQDRGSDRMLRVEDRRQNPPRTSARLPMSTPDRQGRPSSPCSHAFCERIVRVSARIEAIEGRAIVRIERKTERNPFWQIRVRDEVTAERDQTRIALGKALLGGL